MSNPTALGLTVQDCPDQAQAAGLAGSRPIPWCVGGSPEVLSDEVGVADAVETQLTRLLAATPGQILTNPARRCCRAGGGFAAHSLLIATLDSAHESLPHDGA